LLIIQINLWNKKTLQDPKNEENRKETEVDSDAETEGNALTAEDDDEEEEEEEEDGKVPKQET